MALSFTGVLYLASGASPSTASAYRCLLVVPILVVLTAREERIVGPRPWAVRRWALLAGVGLVLAGVTLGSLPLGRLAGGVRSRMGPVRRQP